MELQCLPIRETPTEKVKGKSVMFLSFLLYDLTVNLRYDIINFVEHDDAFELKPMKKII